jgi:hypothetical protein
VQLGAVVQGRLVYQSEGKSDKVVHLKPAMAARASAPDMHKAT